MLQGNGFYFTLLLLKAGLHSEVKNYGQTSVLFWTVAPPIRSVDDLKLFLWEVRCIMAEGYSHLQQHIVVYLGSVQARLASSKILCSPGLRQLQFATEDKLLLSPSGVAAVNFGRAFKGEL